jgi:hypothetical protein
MRKGSERNVFAETERLSKGFGFLDSISCGLGETAPPAV